MTSHLLPNTQLELWSTFCHPCSIDPPHLLYFWNTLRQIPEAISFHAEILHTGSLKQRQTNKKLLPCTLSHVTQFLTLSNSYPYSNLLSAQNYPLTVSINKQINKMVGKQYKQVKQQQKSPYYLKTYFTENLTNWPVFP
jgi:hypothetical protein